jgi:nitroimidazol reductase NimA-like FMN-containing flavoprotein (pyridoxamine 5'-phosphate oxidase superfamily)
MDRKLQDQIVSIIDDVNDMTIATVRQDGFPQATTVSYFNDGLTIYFLTSAESQKAKNIASSNRVSLTIDRDYSSWNEIESLSMGALATAVTDPAELGKVRRLLLKKFPEAAKYETDDDNWKLAYFRIDPVVISVIDYSKGFGHTELVTV